MPLRIPTDGVLKRNPNGIRTSYHGKMRWLLLGATAAALVLAASATAAKTPLVVKAILLPSQVGNGYVLVTRSDGYGLTTRTLDLCGTTNYPSEALRTSRLQVNYLKRNVKLGLSNEVVTYRAGGAAQAMRELTSHAFNCPRHKIDPGEDNLPPLLFTITRLKDSHLLKGYLAVRIQVTGKLRNGKRVDETSYAVYQRVGNLFSGVYSFQKNPVTRAQMTFCLHAAEQSARNLRKLFPATTGPTA
jgi:hypothetical protein